MSERDRLKSVNLDFRNGVNLVKLKAEITNIMALFEEAGALEIDLPSLLDATALIDLYGEDIRNRAYTITDPFGEKKILRPDFTVPVVQLHIASGNKRGRYSYTGPVWRFQPAGSKSPSEYYQSGFEYFHKTEPSEADAEVFELFWRYTDGLELNIELGDMGIIRAVVNCLDISENKRALLLRHLWRPDRFKQLLKQLSSDDSGVYFRGTLFQALKNNVITDYIKSEGSIIGQRSIDEIISRSKELLNAELFKPIPEKVVSLVKILHSLDCKLIDAPKKIREFLHLGTELADVSDNLSSRIESMAKRGIDVTKLNFVTTLSGATPEYYDGFIFTSRIRGAPNLPPVAQGGRYNALTSILGKGAAIPAVGGIIRPEILSSFRDEA